MSLLKKENKLLKLWYKIERILNIIIIFLIKIFFKVMHFIIPDSFKVFVKTTREKIVTKTIEKYEKCKTRCLFLYEFLKKAINFIWYYLRNFNEIASKVTEYFDQIDIKDVSVGALIKLTFKFIYSKIKLGIDIFLGWYRKLPAYTFLTIIILLLVTTTTVIFVYKSSKNIYHGIFGKDEEIIILDKALARPKYYKQSTRHLKLTHIEFPVHVESVKSIQTLDVDLIIQTSNRYLKQFFKENEHLIHDQLGSSMEPIIAHFPLTEEGKKIIRDKIIEELNILIKKQNIEGHVEKVYFVSIIAV